MNLRRAVTQTGGRRLRRDVEAADSEIDRKYADDPTRFSTGLVGPSDAADVVSEAVLSCLDSPEWPTVVDKRSYLYRCVYNQAAQFHRSSRRRRFREERTAQSDTVESLDVRPEVLAAVAGLSVKQRAVIVLTYWEDLDPASVASLMAIGQGSVKRHLARARTRLKEALHADD